MAKIKQNIGTPELFQFFGDLCNKNGIKPDELSEICGLSRSTNYRYMRGLSAIPHAVESKYATALNMTSEDRIKLKKMLFNVPMNEKNMVIWQIIDSFLFEQHVVQEHDSTEFIFYNRDRYIRTLNEIVADILSYSDSINFSANINIINCSHSKSYDVAFSFANLLLASNKNITVEHLYPLSSKNQSELIGQFFNLFPLLKHTNYSLYYANNNVTESTLHSNNDEIIMEVSYVVNDFPEKVYYAVSFPLTGYLSCVKFQDNSVFHYLMRDFEIYKEKYNACLVDVRNMSALNEKLSEFESSSDFALIKADFCYNIVPPEMYKSLFERATEEEATAFVQSVLQDLDTPQDIASVLSKTGEVVNMRYNATYKFENINICTPKAIAKFAQTGLFCDNAVKLPPFNVKERISILESVLTRSNDREDPYRLFLIPDSYNSEYIISVAKGIGAFFSGGDTTGNMKNLMITNPVLAQIFYSYVATYIPKTHAFSSEDTTEIFNQVIAELKQTGNS